MSISGLINNGSMASRGIAERGRAGKRLSSKTCLSEADQQIANVHFVIINLATVPRPHPIIAFVLLLPVSCCSLPTSIRKESSAESLARIFKWVNILLVNINRHIRVNYILNIIVYVHGYIVKWGTSSSYNCFRFDFVDYKDLTWISFIV